MSAYRAVLPRMGLDTYASQDAATNSVEVASRVRQHCTELQSLAKVSALLHKYDLTPTVPILCPRDMTLLWGRVIFNVC